MIRHAAATLAATALLFAAPVVQARDAIDPARVRAHIAFLADPAMRGRGSLTPDEATAAAYVAAQFQSSGLARAPGMDSYIQSTPVFRQKLAGAPLLLVDGVAVPGAVLLSGAGGMSGGAIAVLGRGDPKAKAAVLVVPDGATPAGPAVRAAAAAGATLVVVAEGPLQRRALEAGGGRPRLPAFFPGDAPGARPAIVAVPAAALPALTRPGAKALLVAPFTLEQTATTNAVAYLPGTDPAAGVILLSAHLDHLGVAPDGQIWPGANDDASGVAALLEIAHALATGKRLRRGVLFVAYGSEEAGGFGARWFGDHPPVPLASIAANIEFEMLGEHVPKLAPDRLQMTGFERSNLGPALKRHGALIDADPYPEENYFRRSDNYALALRGVVAHTLSGHGAGVTYHTPQDTLDSVDFAFMTRAIRSLVAPVRWLANGSFVPEWNAGQRPKE